MEQQALGPTELRVIMTAVGIVVCALIYLFGRPKKEGQGRRRFFHRAESERIEPTIDADGMQLIPDDLDIDFTENKVGDKKRYPKGESNSTAQHSNVSVRVNRPVERLVSLFVAARAGETIPGADLVVAAEKAGLEFGDMGIFHRMATGKIDQGAIFSMANMVKPGSFDMARIDELQTPGVSFFMALPGPISALDAWDAMLPTAQRMSELLGAMVLDEERNALGRQRIAHIRDELRAWDRKQENNQIRPGWG